MNPQQHTSTALIGAGEQAEAAEAGLHRRLSAGPLTAIFDAGDLRYIKLGEREVIRRIYAAVRDRNWRTVPARLTNLEFNLQGDQFQIHYLSTHLRDDVHFVWEAKIVGEPDGSIRFTFDGVAKSTFLRNRIGFCVLHPIRECAGARCRASYADGTPLELTFPRLVSAEQPVGGMKDLVGLAHEVEPQVWLEMALSGDLFEMEDQRNWIDASFKTYCTPLRIPFPAEIQAGTRVRQEVRFKVVDERPKRAGQIQAVPVVAPEISERPGQPTVYSEPAVQIVLTDACRPLPPIGLNSASHGQPLAAREIEQLAWLKLGHLRCEVRLARTDWTEGLRLGCEQAAALGLPLELAVFLASRESEKDLAELAQSLRPIRGSIVRILLLRDGEKTLSLESFLVARRYLECLEVPLGAGTDADFYQLNQFRPPYAEADFLHWTMNPQSHAFDLASLRETPPAIPAQLESAAQFFPGKPLVISPITLKPRFNAVATGPEPAVPPGELPPQVDLRQLEPFGAAWTLAVLKYIAESGAHSVTLFETSGWRGVMERTTGSPLPTRFPSEAGQVFPIFYSIAAVNRFAGGEVRISHSSDPLRIESMALRKNGQEILWLANVTDQVQMVATPVIGHVSGQGQLRWNLPHIWKFQPATMMESARSPVQMTPAGDGELVLEPYELRWLETKAEH